MNDKDDEKIDSTYNDKSENNDFIYEKIKERRKKRKRKNKRKSIIKALLIIFCFICVAFLTAAGVYFFMGFNASKSAGNINSFFEENFFNRRVYLDGNKSICFFDPIFQNDEIYVELSFITSNLSYNALYDYDNNILSIATDFDRVKIVKDQNFYFVNGVKTDFGKPPFLYYEDQIYLAGSIIENFYDADLIFSSEYKTLCVENTLEERTIGFVNGNADILNDDYKSFSFSDNMGNNIDAAVFNGDSVLIYYETDGFAKIRTDKGVVGFIESSLITDRSIKESVVKVKKEETITEDKKTVILFEQVTNTVANVNSTKKEIPAGVDVLVPTWFSFNDNGGKTNGTIVSLADKRYVDYVHTSGRKVWGLITDNFKSDISRGIVKSSVVRENVVNQIESLVKQYNLDGINIDFENVPKDSMREFTQFLRELSACLNNLGVSLSIDIYIPQPWSSYYNRKEFGEIVDYFIVMGYDQHTDNSEESGSVATIKWSEDSILLTEEEGVPKEKLILAIPFYTRIWKENSDGTIESTACSMAEGYKFMTDKGGSFKWLSEDGQNYSEILNNGILYKTWLEDEKSVEERLKLIKKYDIAGVAAWRRGLEKQEVWPIIKNYMKGQ